MVDASRSSTDIVGNPLYQAGQTLILTKIAGDVVGKGLAAEQVALTSDGFISEGKIHYNFVVTSGVRPGTIGVVCEDDLAIPGSQEAITAALKAFGDVLHCVASL
ncbi:MAG: hypothetical protein US89_C0009G0005 [Candidatus Peregrinibacteria bacterium GW2011_GWF2_38_29]|nr:MAG: hypothetical protein US89_C0009G0005 [Candidatus Peregrinibacteria bacterium GW2011_GWF2_38_29]HBB02815.1 hypothetical protein [Candidatus Peregrinibacteria bacterium]